MLTDVLSPTAPRRSRTRTAASALAALALVALAGCGSDDPDAGGEPTRPPTSSNPHTAGPGGGDEGGGLELTGPVAATKLALVHRTKGDGKVDGLAHAVGTPQQLQAFTRPLAPVLRDDVVDAVGAHPAKAGETMYASVVHVGCSAPSHVEVTATDEGLAVRPTVTDQKIQCFAPVTYVLVLSAPPTR